MRTSKRNRERLESLYNHHYHRPNCNLEECIYCGEPRDCLDHAPPLAAIENMNIKSFYKNGGRFVLYPSCRECNELLRTFPAFELEERLDHLIKKREAKIKGKEVWTEDEIEEMGDMMRDYIISKNNKLVDMEKRIDYHYQFYDKIVFLEEFDKEMFYYDAQPSDYKVD